MQWIYCCMFVNCDSLKREKCVWVITVPIWLQVCSSHHHGIIKFLDCHHGWKPWKSHSLEKKISWLITTTNKRRLRHCQTQYLTARVEKPPTKQRKTWITSSLPNIFIFFQINLLFWSLLIFEVELIMFWQFQRAKATFLLVSSK